MIEKQYFCFRQFQFQASLKKISAFCLPKQKSFMSLSLFSSRYNRAALIMFALKPPHSPESDVTITNRVLLLLGRSIRSGCISPFGPHWQPEQWFCPVLWHKGRALIIFSWARRNLAAATICMALVYFLCRLNSRNATFNFSYRSPYYSLLFHYKRCFEFLD